MRRTALVLCGTGAHGAYHAGVLRALHEAGVKVDVMAGRGVGVPAAMLLAAHDGSRLWEPGGLWHEPVPRSFYRWSAKVRALAIFAATGLGLVIASLAAVIVGGGTLPDAAIAAGVLGAVAALGLAALALVSRPSHLRRRPASGWWRSALGAPLDADPARRTFTDAVWRLIRGASEEPGPLSGTTGRRYAELLAENLGQPGFRELMVVATDLDARNDVVAALLAEPYRREFIAPQPGRERRAEVLDLAGAGRDYVVDVMAGALTPPVVCESWPVSFAADGYWRGETHRLCDRPGSIVRLLEELSGAGVSQVVIVSAVAVASAPHHLRAVRPGLQGRLGEFVEAAEGAALHDALALADVRFDACYVIAPAHNPIGPFDVGGAYDETSDRRYSVGELLERGYEDAYHQFIEPVVGASGEQLPQLRGRQRAPAGHMHDQGLFDDADPQR